MPTSCQVDFYVLKTPSLDARKLACRLAMMAWERGHHITLITDSESLARDMDDLLWELPADRFLPHGLDTEPEGKAAPVTITTMPRVNAGDVMINLSLQAIPEPLRFNRLLEIVSQQEDQLLASREKYRYYKDQGITPMTHEINK